MLIIPLQAVPSQRVNVVLNSQLCTIQVYQKFWGLFCDVLVNNAVIIQGVICQNRNLIVRSFYLGFSGDLFFFDTQGASNPDYEGLGTNARFLLVYAAPSELPDDYGIGPFDADANIDLADWNAAFPAVAVGASSEP